MNWQMVNANAARTECKRFSVCRVTYVNKHGPYPVWEAWRGKEMIGAHGSQEQARKACEEAK